MGFSAKRRRAVADQNKYFSRVDQSRLQSSILHGETRQSSAVARRHQIPTRFSLSCICNARGSRLCQGRCIDGDLTSEHLSQFRGHPAHGQYGLFATCRIKPDTRILDYFGTVSQHSSQFMTTLKTNISQAKYIAIHDLTRIMISPFTGFPTARA